MKTGFYRMTQIIEDVKTDMGLLNIRNERNVIRNLIVRAEREIQPYHSLLVRKKMIFRDGNGNYDKIKKTVKIPEDFYQLDKIGCCKDGLCPGSYYEVPPSHIVICDDEDRDSISITYLALMCDENGDPLTTYNHSEAVVAFIIWKLTDRLYHARRANRTDVEYRRRIFQERCHEARGEDFFPSDEALERIHNIFNADQRELEEIKCREGNDYCSKCECLYTIDDEDLQNTAPTIEDNIINLPISNELQLLPYNEVIYNYSDEENNLISRLVITENSEKHDLFLNEDQVVLGEVYKPNVNFNSKYTHNPDNIYLIKNSDDTPCVPSIISINKDSYENTIDNGSDIIDIHDSQSGNTIFQKIVNDVQELPNDTIVYVHIDTTSMLVPDQETIRDVVLEWWEEFQNDNPDFQGSLIINTVRNDNISDNFAPGREANGIIGIDNDVNGIYEGGVNNPIERWLMNPNEGLMRDAYRSGVASFPEEEDFVNYIKGKSLIVLTFVDETDNALGYGDYHVAHWVDFYTLKTQPTSAYIKDYNNFTNTIRPNLNFFKGVLYPITRTGAVANNSFLLHAMAAIEGTILNESQIDALLGPDKIAKYTPAILETYFYSQLRTYNPYSPYRFLKSLGWEGRFDKFSPASDVFTSEEFKEELDDILTSTTDVEVSFIQNTNISSENLGSSLQSKFSLKVRDNHPRDPLYSNEAEITVNYNASCEDTECSGETKSISTDHKETNIFTIDDFSFTDDTKNIKIVAINIPNGQLKYFNYTIIESSLPILIKREDIESGNFYYVPDDSVQEEYSIDFDFTSNSYSSDNYCKDINKITLTKNENPNSPATIVTEDKNLILQSPDDTTTTTIQTTITYDGEGDYIIWTRESGSADVQLLNPNEEDLQLNNLKEGIYSFKCLVITIEDGFRTEATSVVTVSVANQPPTVDAGPDKNTTTTTATAEATASDSDGTIDVIAWTQDSGPNTATINNPATLNPTFTGLAEGVYVFRITVTDNDGASADDIMSVTVNPPNQPPIPDAGANRTITLPTSSVTLNGSNSYDPDGTIVSYSWSTVIGGNETIQSPNSVITDVTGLEQGTYIFELEVTDNDGATNTDIVTITVEPDPGTPPVATINLTTSMPTTGGVSFSVTGTDSDGTVVSWSLDFGDGSTVLTGTGAPQDEAFPPIFHNYTTNGNYEMILTVTDNDGLSDTDTKSIIVNSNLNSEACISGDVYAKKNETAQAPDAILDLDVLITDKNGSPAVSGQYRIISVSSDGNTAIIDGSSGPFTNFTGNNFTINRNLEVYPQLPTADPIDEIRIEFLVSYQDGSNASIPWVATYGLSSEDTSNDYFPPGSSGVPFFKGIYNLQCNINTNPV